ncbi:MAG: LysE family translocator [Gammaproteobacteria bacterium]
MSEYALAAFVFGLAAGFTPGPLSIIVIQQTLDHGLKNGIKAAIAPIISDGPIIFFVYILFNKFQDIDLFIGVISLLGALFLFWIAIKMSAVNDVNISTRSEKANSLSTAVKVNLLNPHAYIFWFTVGGAYIASGTKLEAITFVFIMISTLILSKIFLASLISKFRKFLNSNSYLWMMRTLGLLLGMFSFLLLYRSYNILFV